MDGTDAALVARVTILLIGIGVGFIFLLAQDRTRTSVALASLFVLVGIDFATASLLIDDVDPEAPSLLSRIQGLLDSLVMVAAAAYIGALADSSQASEAARRLVRFAISGS